MRKILLASSVLLILAVAGVAVFILLHRPGPAPASEPPAEPPSIARLEAEDLPPLPDLSLQVNNEQTLEVAQGTPLIFVVAVANPRAANAAATRQAHEAYLAVIQEKIAKREISAADAELMLARSEEHTSELQSR